MAIPVLEDPVGRFLAARDDAEEALPSDEAMAFSLTAESGTEGFGFENIVGVGLGERMTNGHPTAERAVIIYVVRKAAPDRIDDRALAPRTYQGIPTDVVESGEFVAFTERGRHRPLISGISIGHYREDAGTLGFVASDSDHDLVLVSNNHVLALINEGNPGDAIVQPAHADGGIDADRVASLKQFHALDFSGPNLIDAATALKDPDQEAIHTGIYGLAGPYRAQPLDAADGMLVRKVGRTSGMTRGIVRDAHASIKLRYRHGVLRLREQLLVHPRDAQPFSEGGDSGSLVIEESSRCPVGLLCGGAPRYSVINRIQNVLQGLDLSLVL